MAKILSTRVKNRFDTLANWIQPGVELLPGEIALVSVTEQKIDSTTGNVVNVPAILMKVGAYKKDASGNPTTELETFDNLPWLSAKAADVYNWAKSEKAEDVTIKIITDTSNNKTETKKLSAWLESFYNTNKVNTAAIEAKADAANVYAKGEADTAVQTAITQALAALSHGSSGSGSFVTNVTQSKGKVTVTKGSLPAASTTAAGIAKLGATGGAATYDTVDAISKKVTALESAVAGGVHFVGEVTVPANLFNNLTTQTVTIVKSGEAPGSYTAKDGDVVIQGEKEYIWAAGAWKELGDLSRVGKLETLTDGLISTKTDHKFVTHIIKDANNKLVAQVEQPLASDVYYDTASGEKTVAVELTSQDARLKALEAVNVSNLITTAINKLDHTTSGNGSFVTNVTQTDGKVTVTKGNLPTANTTTAGIVKLGADGGAATHSALTAASAKISALETGTLQFESSTMKLYGGTGRQADDEIIFDCGGAL